MSDSELFQDIDCAELEVGCKVIDCLGKENAVTEVEGVRCVVINSPDTDTPPWLDYGVFLTQEHYLRNKEASEIAEYVSRKLEWGVIPKGVTLEDLQLIKGIIDKEGV